MTLDELLQLNPAEVQLIDIRSKTVFSYGSIPGAINIPENELIERLDELNKAKKIVLLCIRGERSLIAAEELAEDGIDAESLDGGYFAWLMKQSEKTDEGKRRTEIEHSLQKHFKKKIWCNFTKALKVYKLLEPGDRVAVCISGGKDSALMAMLFKELAKHSEFPFEVKYLVMDPGYSKENRWLIESNMRLLGLDVHIFDSSIFDSVDKVDKYPCYLCARMRRGHLYKFARELGCNKIALGHHYDDVIETILMGMLHGAQIQTMMPKLKSTNFEGMELIRPLYFVRESDIIAWRDYNNLCFLQCACHFTDNCSSCRTDGTTDSKRLETKQLIAQLKKTNPLVESHIFSSVENVCLDMVIEYKQNGTRHNFLENY